VIVVGFQRECDVQEDLLPALILNVSVDAGVSADEVHAIEEAFRRAGLEADVKPSLIELSQASTWIVMISAAPTTFLSAYAAAAGTDAWGATKRGYGRLMQLVRDLRTASGGHGVGRIELEERGRAWLLLTSDLPEEAFRQLEDVNWTAAQTGVLKWDEHRQCWMHLEQGKEPWPASEPQH
jgi:hypothetical protein